MPSEIVDAGEDATAADCRDEGGCRFIIDAADGTRLTRFCGAARRPGSAYCPEHHARCRLRGGSRAERRRLHEIEALAEAVGGRQARAARQPPADVLRRLERAARRAFARAECSCIVLRANDAAHD